MLISISELILYYPTKKIQAQTCYNIKLKTFYTIPELQQITSNLMEFCSVFSACYQLGVQIDEIVKVLEPSSGRLYFMSNYRALFVVKKMSKNTCTLGPSLDRGPAADIGVLGPDSVYMFSGRYCCMPDYPAGRSLNSNCA